MILDFPELLTEIAKINRMIKKKKLNYLKSKSPQKSNPNRSPWKLRVKNEKCQEEWVQKWWKLKDKKKRNKVKFFQGNLKN